MITTQYALKYVHCQRNNPSTSCQIGPLVRTLRTTRTLRREKSLYKTREGLKKTSRIPPSEYLKLENKSYSFYNFNIREYLALSLLFILQVQLKKSNQYCDPCLPCLAYARQGRQQYQPSINMFFVNRNKFYALLSLIFKFFSSIN